MNALLILPGPVNTPIILLFSVFKSMFSFRLPQSNAFDSSNQRFLLKVRAFFSLRGLKNKTITTRLMKRVLTFNWHFVFGAVKCHWLLILALQTTFNVHYFSFVVLVLVINSQPYTARIMIIIVKNTRMSFAFFFNRYGQKTKKKLIPRV
jgi:hypothetical protein